MGKYDSATPYQWRYFFVYLILASAMGALILRVIYLTVIDRSFLLTQGDARVMRVVDIPASRGMILDREGSPLAVSTPVDSVTVNPHKLVANPEQLHQLTTILGLSSTELQIILHKNSHRDFVYLKRRIDPALALQVDALKIPGIALVKESRRYYPEGEVTAHVLGMTNIDDKGEEGMELSFNNYLQGIPGKEKVLKDRYGNTVENIARLRPPHTGHNLTLSIDRKIQFIAYTALKAGTEKFGAASGSVVVVDSRTGEVLAMVNEPSFNPNQNNATITENHRNRAVTDIMEPGSTIKSFSMTNALNSGKYNGNSMIDTTGGVHVGRRTIFDEHPLGRISVREILARSSDVGTVKITLSLPPSSLLNLLHKVGFGQATNSGFYGESSGKLTNKGLSSPSALATVSFGYGMEATPLQLAQAYQVLANHGVKIPLTGLRRDQAVNGVQIIRPQVADEMLQLLRSVVEDERATGHLAKVPGYIVAGKTGTSRIVGKHGYDAKRHNVLFVGVAPVSNPRLVVAVVVRDPAKANLEGGSVAAPIFSEVMSGALRELNIPPDNVNAAATEVAK